MSILIKKPAMLALEMTLSNDFLIESFKLKQITLTNSSQ